MVPTIDGQQISSSYQDLRKMPKKHRPFNSTEQIRNTTLWPEFCNSAWVTHMKSTWISYNLQILLWLLPPSMVISHYFSLNNIAFATPNGSWIDGVFLLSTLPELSCSTTTTHCCTNCPERPFGNPTWWMLGDRQPTLLWNTLISPQLSKPNATNTDIAIKVGNVESCFWRGGCVLLWWLIGMKNKSRSITWRTWSH
jgi:hypothetical protein